MSYFTINHSECQVSGKKYLKFFSETGNGSVYAVETGFKATKAQRHKVKEDNKKKPDNKRKN